MYFGFRFGFGQRSNDFGSHTGDGVLNMLRDSETRTASKASLVPHKNAGKCIRASACKQT